MFMERSEDSLRAFWDDVSLAVPTGFGLIHYNQPRLPNYLDGVAYRRLAAQIPNLIGTKLGTTDFDEFAQIVQLAPELAHLTGEPAVTPFLMFGARGICSWFTSFNARYMVEWYDDCVAGRWEAARHRQERMHAFHRLKREVFGKSTRHAVINKAVGAASNFLVGTQRTRRPYLPVPDAAVAEFRRRSIEEFPDLQFRA